MCVPQCLVVMPVRMHVAGWVAGSMHVLVVGVVSVAMLVAHAFVNVLVLVALRRV